LALFTLLTEAIGPQKTPILKYANQVGQKKKWPLFQCYIFVVNFRNLGRIFFAENENKETKK
jgi:hypothetical protein